MLHIIVRVTVIAALVVAGLSAGLGYGHLQLGKEQQINQNKINGLHRRMALVEKKASDEREARSSIENQNRTLQAEIEKLRKENGEQSELIQRVVAEAQSFEAKLKDATRHVALEKATREQVSAQLGQALHAARELEGQASELEGQAKWLTSGKQTLEASLIKVNQDLDTCRNHNARLCLIADEILKKRESMGTAGGVLQGLGLPEMREAELEKFRQKYRDKIEQEKLQKEMMFSPRRTRKT